MTSHIPAAGITTKFTESCSECLSWYQENEERPETPDSIRKYRQSKLHQTGKIIRHWGLDDDQFPNGPFGVKTTPDETIKETIRQIPDSQIDCWKLEQQEKIYASSKKEPLGKGYVRGHKIPYELGKEKAFGQPSVNPQQERQFAKDVIFPIDSPVQQEGQELYKQSHGDYEAGEQRKRGYNWDAAGIDPQLQRFGSKTSFEGENVQTLLNHGGNQSLTVQSKLHEDYQLTNRDFLGEIRHIGNNTKVGSDHVYGVSSVRFPEASVEELLHGQYSIEECQPDGDLGKSLHEGWRNRDELDNGRAFGVPTVRIDLPEPGTKSVANSINYGNEPSAIHLLNPCATADRGVNESHYLKPRGSDEIQEILCQAGVQISEEEFKITFDRSSAIDGHSENNLCSLQTFMEQRHKILQSQ